MQHFRTPHSLRHAELLPLYVMVARANLINTYAGLIIIGLSSASGIFMMRQFMMTIPDELLDAARIDGAGEFRIFNEIVIPLLKPALATQSLFTFTRHWGAYVWPLIWIYGLDTSGQIYPF